MPRQLPWLSNGKKRQAQLKQPPKVINKSEPLSDIDDDYLRSAALTSSKGKGRAVEVEDSEDDLPPIAVRPSAFRQKSSRKDMLQDTRIPSSSPPPSQDFSEPKVEFMHKGVSKFDLRDDEWMMVEDEFLETAKLFTRHLHIAEYQKLKKRIEEKKRAGVKAERPVVKGATMSFEGKMKEKAKAQDQKQRNAIREVFAIHSSEDSAEENPGITNSHSHRIKTIPRFASNEASSSSFKRPSRPLEIRDSQSDTDSDDLDAPKSMTKSTWTKPPMKRSTLSNPIATPNAITKSASSPIALTKPEPSPSARKPRPSTSRRSRATPFDMLDGYTPPTNRAKTPLVSPQESFKSRMAVNTTQASPPIKIEPTSTQKHPSLDFEDDDDWASNRRESSKDTTERLVKRKAEGEKEREEKRRAVKLDDIPTFLF